MKKRALIAAVAMLLILCLAMPCLAAKLSQKDIDNSKNSKNGKDNGVLDYLQKNSQSSDGDVCTDDFGFYSDDKYDAYAEWRKSGKDLKIRFKMKNLSDCDAVDAFDIAIYCTNAYGEMLCPDDCGDEILYFTSDQTYKPGRTAYSNYCVMEGCKSAKTFHAALTRYHIKDGETVSLGDSSESDPLKKYDWLSWDVD